LISGGQIATEGIAHDSADAPVFLLGAVVKRLCQIRLNSKIKAR